MPSIPLSILPPTGQKAPLEEKYARRALAGSRRHRDRRHSEK
jgi:hypothetical protein